MSQILIGKGMHISKGNGHLIITLEAETIIGQDIADKDGNPMGRIFDVFGPVGNPFASIKLIEGYPMGNPAGKPVFLGERPKKPYDKRKKRRDRKRKSR
jgi:rRNA processing protein Gar1